MGNQVLENYNKDRSFELYLEDLGNINVEKEVGSGRLFTTVQCWSEDYQFTIVKVYLKASAPSPALSRAKKILLETHKQLTAYRNPNILPYSRIFETDKAAYLIRPFIHSNLTDRLSTRPFLNTITKKWISYQLMVSLYEIHRQQRYHGDLKSSNVLLTGWDWVFLTDLGNFKPLLLSKSNTRTMFAAYFDTSGRSLTTLAPERIMVNDKDIIDSNKKLSEEEEAKIISLRRKSDAFSLGCVIAEIFLDGEGLFQFEQLLVFRNGNTEHVNKMTNRIENPHIRSFVKRLVDLDPEKRPDCATCIESSERAFIPGFFRELHNVFSRVLHLSSDDRLLVLDLFFWDLLDVLRSNGMIVSEDLHSYLLTGKYDDILKKRKNQKGKRKNQSTSGQPHQQQQQVNNPGTTSYEEEETEGEDDDESKEKKKLENVSKVSDKIKKLGTGKREKDMIDLLEDTRKLISIIQGSSSDENSGFSNVPNDGVFRYTEKDVKPQRFQITRRVPTAASLELKKDKTFKIPKDQFAEEAREGIDILASLICASIPTARAKTVLLRSLHHLKVLSYYCTDYTIIQRIIPYACTLLTEETLPIIKSGAIITLSFSLEQLEKLPRSETNLFIDYILPYLRPLAHDRSELVRATFAEHLPLLANHARKLLDMESLVLQKRRKEKLEHQVISSKTSVDSPVSTGIVNEGRKFYDEKLSFLRTEFLRLVEDLSKDRITEVKISLLRHMSSFCYFCGKKITQSTVLPLLTIFLNSNAFRLRAAFFETVANAARYIGVNGIKTLVLPVIDPLLYDADEFVVDSVLQGIMLLTKQNMIGRSDLLSIVSKITPLLIHPNPWIRDHTIGVIVEAVNLLGDVDTHCFIIPALQPFLAVTKLSVINEYALYEGLIPPVSLELYERGISHFTDRMTDNQMISLDEWKKLLDLSSSYRLTQEDINRLMLLSPFITKTGEQLRKRQTLSPSLPTNSSSSSSKSLPIGSGGSFGIYDQPTSSLGGGKKKKKMGMKGGKLKFNQMSKEGLEEESLSFQAFFETDAPVQNVLVETVREKGDFLKKRAISLRAAGVNDESSKKKGGASSSKQHTTNQNFDDDESVTMRSSTSTLYDHITSSSQHQHHPSSQPFRPIGTLYTESYEHQDEITSLWFVDDPNQHFLISSSKDFTVKVWDVRSMGGSGGTGRPKRETYLFRSMLTYPLPGHRIGYSTDVCCLPLRPLIALTTSMGWLQIWDYSANRVTDSMVIRDDRAVFLEDHKFKFGTSSFGKIDNFSSASMNVVRPLSLENSSVLLVGTEHGNIHVIDKKSHAEIFTLKSGSSLRKGPISCLCGTESWIVSGTERGFLTLWDLRFQLPVHTVRLSSDAINEALVIHPSSVLVANASSVVHEWSLQKNRKVKSYQCYHYDNNTVSSQQKQSKKKTRRGSKRKRGMKIPKIRSDDDDDESQDEEDQMSTTTTTTGESDDEDFDDDEDDDDKSDRRMRYSFADEEEDEENENSEQGILRRIRRLMKEAKEGGIVIEGSLGESLDGKYDPFGIEELEKLAWEKRRGVHEILSICRNDRATFFSVGTDRFIRLWNSEIPQNSYVLSGLENNELSVYKSVGGSSSDQRGGPPRGRARSSGGGRGKEEPVVVQENIVDGSFDEDRVGVFNVPMKNRHKSSIVKCCVINNKRGGMKLLTADKDGVMKFWD